MKEFLRSMGRQILASVLRFELPRESEADEKEALWL